jgi:hypothetical protein
MDPQDGTTWIGDGGKLQIIAISLINFADIDSLYAEGWVHVKAKAIRSISIVYYFLLIILMDTVRVLVSAVATCVHNIFVILRVSVFHHTMILR